MIDNHHNTQLMVTHDTRIETCTMHMGIGAEFHKFSWHENSRRSTKIGCYWGLEKAAEMEVSFMRLVCTSLCSIHETSFNQRDFHIILLYLFVLHTTVRLRLRKRPSWGHNANDTQEWYRPRPHTLDTT